jgi:hypothetical protein
LDLIATLTTTKFSKYLLFSRLEESGLRKNKIRLKLDVNGSVKTVRIVKIQISI